ncbi:DUF1501 domain-containing protein [Stieleria varia]|uniref:Sulfatase n=1 Tax=Stieleria varia TaxID=2528005 RepID=A0A5C6A3X2_9BACT|nr:DUF1501 domain-containing protein [Stieleria varia]TWT93968.1 hypothetical protein Pla52n_57970 [Stieleria varia]
MATSWRNCEGIARRDCLRLGLGGLISGGLTGALRARAHANDSFTQVPSEREADACILVWLDGGPSHYETFDPKPDAPVEIRGSFPPIRTQTSGVYFSQPMQKLAAMSDDLAIVRSIRHDQGNHGAGNHYMMTGAPPRIPVGCGAFVSFHPSLGSVAAQQIGAPHGIPAYFSLPSMSRSGGPNFLGSQYAPFVVPDDPNSSSFRVRDVTIPTGLTADRFGSRQDIRQRIDTMMRLNDPAVADPVVAMDRFYQQSLQIISSPQAQAAFDIHQESNEVREAYGRNSFGQRALLARRLVGAGVPFVTLYHGGWDHHVSIFEELEKKLPPFEATVAALIADLKQTGMLERTLVVVLGEFGRTPKINERGGRDHWSNAMSVMFAGGGVRGGQIVGATDKQGYSAVERVLSPENFVSTIYRKLGIDPGQTMHTPEGRPVHLVSDATPIMELMA